MGGSSYDVPVGIADSGNTYSSGSNATYRKVRAVDQQVIPNKGIKITTEVKNPIVVALDVTGSMGDSARIMYDKMPMFWGQLEQQGYLKDMAISFCCVGDVHSDQAPLQVTPFEQAKAIHPWLEKLWLTGLIVTHMDQIPEKRVYCSRYANFPELGEIRHLASCPDPEPVMEPFDSVTELLERELSLPVVAESHGEEDDWLMRL